MTYKAIIIAILITIALYSVANAGALQGSVDTEVTLPAWGYLGGFDVTPSGNFLVNDGFAVREIDRAGANVRTLYSYTEPFGVWASFVKYNAGRVYFGESMNSNIYSCDYSNPTDAAVLASLPNNFDISFSGGKPYVAATAADYSSTSVYMLDGGTKDVIIDKASGPSGPLAFDSSGNLYYALGSTSSSLYGWSAAEVASATGAGKLTVGPGNELAGVPGPYGFAIDSRNYLFYSTNWTAISQIGYRTPGGTLSTRALLDIPGLSAQYGVDPLFKGIAGAYITTLAYDAPRESLSAAVSYNVVYWTDGNQIGTTKVPHTVISTIAVPEPSSILSLCGLLGLCATTIRRLRP